VSHFCFRRAKHNRVDFDLSTTAAPALTTGERHDLDNQCLFLRFRIRLWNSQKYSYCSHCQKKKASTNVASRATKCLQRRISTICIVSRIDGAQKTVLSRHCFGLFGIVALICDNVLFAGCTFAATQKVLHGHYLEQHDEVYKQIVPPLDTAEAVRRSNSSLCGHLTTTTTTTTTCVCRSMRGETRDERTIRWRLTVRQFVDLLRTTRR
jgi:hypothetical protein